MPHEIVSLREKMAKKGISFVIHGDAASGGGSSSDAENTQRGMSSTGSGRRRIGSLQEVEYVADLLRPSLLLLIAPQHDHHRSVQV